MDTEVTTADLLGAWDLVAWQIRYPDATITHPFGPAATGLIVYTPDGRMSAVIAAAERAMVGDGDVRGAPLDQQAAAFRSYFSYAGTFAVQDGAVVHRVQLSLNPAFVGSTQRRLIDLDGDRLTLSADERARGGVRSHSLIWHRSASTL